MHKSPRRPIRQPVIIAHKKQLLTRNKSGAPGQDGSLKPSSLTVFFLGLSFLIFFFSRSGPGNSRTMGETTMMMAANRAESYTLQRNCRARVL